MMRNHPTIRTTQFTPPTAEQVAEHLANHPIVGGTMNPRVIAMIILGVLVVILLLVPDMSVWLMPWLVMGFIGLLFYMALRTQQNRRHEQDSLRIGELAMLRRYSESLRRAWELLPKSTRHPGRYGRTVANIGHCLDELKEYDAAIIAYDHLLQTMPPEHPATVHLQISRAIASLCNDQLTDGDEWLRRIRNVIQPFMGSPVGASYQLARLIQDVRTAHYDEAIRMADELLDDLRPLGIEAGYGHGLMALCYYHRNMAESNDRELAGTWWQRAQLLLPRQVLTYRFPELTRLTNLT